jgi:hypothetical protein
MSFGRFKHKLFEFGQDVCAPRLVPEKKVGTDVMGDILIG